MLLSLDRYWMNQSETMLLAPCNDRKTGFARGMLKWCMGTSVDAR